LLPSVTSAQARSTAPRRVETYERVSIDGRNLVIVTTDRRTIVVPKEREQTTFGKPMLSSDRTAVGAQAEFPNCCTSYDIPLQLVVYANGKIHRFTGVGLPIFRWHFVGGGRRVAYSQETVHFACVTHYELRDVETERRLDSADVPQPCGQDPNPTIGPLPSWIVDLNSDTAQ
jgi:hypothetical protein